MKKLLKTSALALAIIAMSIVSASAQRTTKGDKAIGANFSYGMGNDYTNFGFGIKAQYNMSDPIRLEGAFTKFFERKDLSMWDFSLYGHYMLGLTHKFAVYPIAGVGIYHTKSDLIHKTTHNDPSITLGAGFDLRIAGSLIWTVDLKYKLVDYMNRTVLSTGLSLRF